MSARNQRLNRASRKDDAGAVASLSSFSVLTVMAGQEEGRLDHTKNLCAIYPSKVLPNM